MMHFYLSQAGIHRTLRNQVKTVRDILRGQNKTLSQPRICLAIGWKCPKGNSAQCPHCSQYGVSEHTK